ncbi:MAG: AbrB/MazE/SpoVT family DNA-binding domain-containing protein [Gemmataceae bacterium]
MSGNSFHTKLGDDGRIVIPAECRKRFGLKPGDTVVVEADELGLHLRSMAQVVKDVQAAFAPFCVPGKSVVDELIAERRAEAAAEAAEEEAWSSDGKRD